MRFTRSETNAYLAAQSAELAKLAEEAKLDALAYIFKMAQLEAENAISKKETAAA